MCVLYRGEYFSTSILSFHQNIFYVSLSLVLNLLCLFGTASGFEGFSSTTSSCSVSYQVLNCYTDSSGQCFCDVKVVVSGYSPTLIYVDWYVKDQSIGGSCRGLGTLYNSTTGPGIVMTLPADSDSHYYCITAEALILNSNGGDAPVCSTEIVIGC